LAANEAGTKQGHDHHLNSRQAAGRRPSAAHT
jgi:hypothetical protein